MLNRFNSDPALVLTTNDPKEELQFSVNFFVSKDSSQDAKFLLRHDFEAYSKSCGTTYRLPIFPPRLKEGITYSQEYRQLSEEVLAVTIRRLVLQDDLERFMQQLHDLDTLVEFCRMRTVLLEKRYTLLEEEMDFLKYSMPNPLITTRFHSLLCHGTSLQIISNILQREAAMLKSNTRAKSDISLLPNDTIAFCWDLIQYWKLIQCVQIRCNCSSDNSFLHQINHMKKGLDNNIQPMKFEPSWVEPSAVTNVMRE